MLNIFPLGTGAHFPGDDWYGDKLSLQPWLVHHIAMTMSGPLSLVCLVAFLFSEGFSFSYSNISHHHWKAAQIFDPGALNSPSSCLFAYMQAKSLFLFPE